MLAAWTLLVWTTRIRNIWTDDSLTTAGQIWRTGLAVVFTGFAVVVVAAWIQARRDGVQRSWAPSAIRLFALWTVGVWAVRGMQIALADHDLAFVLVHTALAVVSIALAWWAVRVSSPSRTMGSEPVGV